MTTASSTNVTVPLLDLKAQYDTIREEIEPVVRDVIESQWFIGGPKLAELEAAIASYCSTSHAVGCASGSDAILLPLQAIGVGAGDRVLCPTYSFFATAGSITRLGAQPLFVDIDPETYNICPESLARAFEHPDADRIKAIVPVHLYGQCADMDAINSIASEHGVPVIEDSAQAIGSEDVHGRRAGSMGTASAFSFFPSKNLGGFGDGGIVTTSDEELAAQFARLRNHGMNPKYYHSEIGMNSRLDALQAAVLIVKLRHLDSWSEGRLANARFYDEAIADAGGATSALGLEESTVLPLRSPAPAAEGARHIYNQYVIRVPAEHRDAVRERLAEARIGSEIYYPLSLHMQDCYSDCGQAEGTLPHAERAARETIALPVYPDLSTDQRAHVAETLVSIVRSL
jgi:dTDP-4-amino-4,6-dideoxygalactose transaminase